MSGFAATTAHAFTNPTITKPNAAKRGSVTGMSAKDSLLASTANEELFISGLSNQPLSPVEISDTMLKELTGAEQIAKLRTESKSLETGIELESQKASIRWAHAKELLGKHYHGSVVKAGENVDVLDDRVLKWTQRGLKKNWKQYSHKVAKAIIEASLKYQFDPIFLIAVIENESSFNPGAVGPVGELGLMQLTPETGKWIAAKFNLPYKNVNTLKDPVQNIRLGAAYMAYLRGIFGFRSQLYIAAYNMGTGNVRNFVKKRIEPKIYSSKVMVRYVRFYSELQADVGRKVSRNVN